MDANQKICLSPLEGQAYSSGHGQETIFPALDPGRTAELETGKGKKPPGISEQDQRVRSRETLSDPGFASSAAARTRQPLSGRVCVLDSDPGTLRDTQEILRSMGYQVLGLDRVIGASNLIREFNPDLLVVEVMMPSVSGAKLIDLLRRNLRDLPVLILYSELGLHDLQRVAQETAADDFLVKDDDYLPLINKVQYYLSLRRRN